MSESKQAKLNCCAWFLEEERRAEAALSFLRQALGTYETDRNTTYAFVDGYLSGIRRMYRRSEEDGEFFGMKTKVDPSIPTGQVFTEDKDGKRVLIFDDKENQ